MSAATTYHADSFTLDYRADQHLLVGRWLRPVSLAESQAIYEAVLQAALAHDTCRHWLLDIRRRPATDEALMQWFGEVYAPRLAAAFQAPVYIAYFAMINHDQAATNVTLERNIQRGHVQGTHYHYGNDEGECLAWLAGCR